MPSPTQPERIIRGAERATCQVPSAGDVGLSQALVSVTGMSTTRSGWFNGVCGMGGWLSKFGLELVSKDREVILGAITHVQWMDSRTRTWSGIQAGDWLRG